MQSAAVSGSTVSARREPSARRSSVAAVAGSIPRSATLDKTSAQFTMLTAEPLAIDRLRDELGAVLVVQDRE